MFVAIYIEVIKAANGGHHSSYLGCFSDSMSDQSSQYLYNTSTDLNVDHCIGFCLSKGKLCWTQRSNHWYSYLKHLNIT